MMLKNISILALCHIIICPFLVSGASLPPRDDPQAPYDAQSTKSPEASQFDHQCDHDQLTILLEFASAIIITTAGRNVHESSPYYQALLSAQNKNDFGFELQVQSKYGKLAALPADKDYKVAVTCVTRDCQELDGRDRYAWASYSARQINLCPAWFDDSRRARSSDVLSQCQPDSPDSDKWSKLSQFKVTKSFALLHELTHLDYATGNADDRARDYAYGFRECRKLAEGQKTNSKLCGKGRNCDAKLSFNNADTLTFVAAGEYYSQVCSKQISADAIFDDVENDIGKGVGEDLDDVNVVSVIPQPAIRS